jgi:hypothetical protein
MDIGDLGPLLFEIGPKPSENWTSNWAGGQIISAPKLFVFVFNFFTMALHFVSSRHGSF